MVRWTGKFAVLATVLSIWAAPLMACMFPGAILTVEERECCAAMASDCGDMDMPASHSCCTITVHEAGPYLVKTSFSGTHSQAAAVLELPQKTTAAAGLTVAKSAVVTPSPPLSPPQTISVLRI